MHYHIPTPFFRKSRSRWYVQINGRQINLGPDKEEAFRRYHQLMAEAASENPAPVRADTAHSESRIGASSDSSYFHGNEQPHQ